jgi:hypothetical protein
MGSNIPTAKIIEQNAEEMGYDGVRPGHGDGEIGAVYAMFKGENIINSHGLILVDYLGHSDAENYCGFLMDIFCDHLSLEKKLSKSDMVCMLIKTKVVFRAKWAAIKVRNELLSNKIQRNEVCETYYLGNCSNEFGNYFKYHEDTRNKRLTAITVQNCLATRAYKLYDSYTHQETLHDVYWNEVYNCHTFVKYAAGNWGRDVKWPDDTRFPLESFSWFYALKSTINLANKHRRLLKQSCITLNSIDERDIEEWRINNSDRQAVVDQLRVKS